MRERNILVDFAVVADTTQRFRGSVRITRIELVDEATRSFKVSGFLKGNVTKSAGGFVRHVPETEFVDVAAVMNPAPRRADAEPDGGEPKVTLAAFEVQEAQAGATCPILVLDIGPIFLNLLGLVVDLDAISLDIIALPGAGNLLGNLLCAVANLLNGIGTGSLAGLLAQINQLLSNILAIIGTIGG